MGFPGVIPPYLGAYNLNLQLVGVHLVVTVVEFEIFEFLSHHFGHDICTERFGNLFCLSPKNRGCHDFRHLNKEWPMVLSLMRKYLSDEGLD